MLVKWFKFCLVCLTLSGAVFIPTHSAHSEEEEVYLHIHKKTHRLVVIMNDVPIFNFPVSTGRNPGLTPEGEFTIVTKVVKPYYLPKKIGGGDPKNPLGSRWIGLNIGNGYKYGIHGTNRPGQIGYSVSSGCIRMRNTDVEYLYRHIPLKTRVVITAE
jgi:lipoprotein-anchoring transpeptidase ErfK/SrfK